MEAVCVHAYGPPGPWCPSPGIMVLGLLNSLAPLAFLQLPDLCHSWPGMNMGLLQKSYAYYTENGSDIKGIFQSVLTDRSRNKSGLTAPRCR